MGGVLSRVVQRLIWAIAALSILTQAGGLRAHALPPEKPVDDYWAETTPLSFDLLKLFLALEECDSSEAKFIGCYAAVNTLARYSRTVLLPLPRTKTTQHRSRAQTPLQAFGPFYVADAAAARTIGAKTSELKRIFADQTSPDHSAQDQASKTDFLAIIDFLAGRIVPNKSEARIAASCVNVYYSTAIDSHSHINPREELAREFRGEKETLVGIGAIFNEVNRRIVVLQPIEESPALRAGLRARDILTAIDGVSIRGMSLDQVISKIRGAIGTVVKLTVKRKMQQLELAITRDQVVIENVRAQLLEDRGAKYGLIRLNSFSSETTCSETERAIDGLKQQGARGLVLDLRGNPGGLLDQALCVGGLFLGSDQVIAQVLYLKNSEHEIFTAPRGITPTLLPMITLIDGGSASASEIVAGALQDHRRSWIAGSRSYGKATVQSPAAWRLGGLPLAKVVHFRTTARFYQPSGRTNQIVGIIPDFLLDPKPFAKEEDRVESREADLFPNALPPEGARWSQSRLAEANAVQRCLQSTHQATQLYAAQQDAAIPPDYALLEAQDLLICAENAPVSRP